MLYVKFADQEKPHSPTGKRKQPKLRQQNPLTEEIQATSEYPDQKPFSGHAERIHLDYARLKCCGGHSPSGAPPTDLIPRRLKL